MIKTAKKIEGIIAALAFTAGALFLCPAAKGADICAYEYVQTCAHTQLDVPVDGELIKGLGKLYSFTTYYDADNTDRCANIRLAAQKIDGTILMGGESFSFNRTVGARTLDRGFRPAKIIEDGRFVPGVGGGVCQVSTTLYNAALLSGLEIEEYHPHSLQVSYVAPSRDAMVSGSYFDLKFKNPYDAPVYLAAKCTVNSICCTVYGLGSGVKYSFLSLKMATVPRPECVILEGDEDKILTYGRDGLESEGYLVAERGGVQTRTLVRKDRYRAVGDVVQIKKSSAI